MRRVFVAGLFHETHGFVEDVTRMSDFRRLRGAEVTARLGDGSVMDGILAVAREEGWEVVAGPDWSAMPSGPVDHAVLVAFLADLTADLRAAGPLDGIVLALHGAMTTTEEEDAEGALLGAIRAVPGAGALPLYAAFDLHATFTDRMARLADGLVGYRENPHIDARETGVRAARLLARCFREGPSRQSWRPTQVMWPPTGTGTADDPMRSLEAGAREIEARFPYSVRAVTVTGGFAFADARDAGVAVSMVLGREDPEAEAALDTLAARAWEMRAAGLPREHGLDEAVQAALRAPRGPVLLVEPADNIGGGAPGDCTPILRALLRHGAPSAGVVLNDAAAVAALQGIEIGGTAALPLGGRGWSGDRGPVTLPVTLLSRSDGRFTLEDRNSHLVASGGVDIRMGDCAVVRHAGITILLTSRKTPPFDLGQWRSQGVEPTALGIIAVKAAVAHRRAYDPIAAASFTVATRGPCASDLSLVPFRRLRPGVFPLSEPAPPSAAA
ncbi:M81 family metallopeptidase [Muricoccus radiodurans]|uniref:M81 family metallopeptidase n=1 Tax=Muricoccus radiodurans TaxID=2231721 RepID=UPI003CE8540F